MPEQVFRYVRPERAAVFEAAGWQVLSGPMRLKSPAGLEGPSSAAQVVLMEWTQAGEPVEPIG
jgi:hypothetical protein